ncbi:MAG TPA: hypothetical protein VJ547_12210 [Candidatus Thermoplasmatota archaeon]|nr:hypothetical protein [Candidatus Thermoplasmatota archaeon]
MKVNGTLDAEVVRANQKMDAVALLIVQPTGIVAKGKQKNQNETEFEVFEGIIMKSPSGAMWRFGVSDTGQPVFTPV